MNNNSSAVDITTFFLQAEAQNIHRYYAYINLINFVQLTISTFGMVFNLSLVYTILHNKSAHSSYGYFLAIASMADTLSETTCILPTFLVLFDLQISMPYCFWLQVHGLLGIILSSWNLLFISLDRLFAVCIPIEYEAYIRSTKKYVALLNCLPLAAFSYLAFILGDCAMRYPKINIFCIQGDIGGDERSNFIITIFSGVTIAPVPIYLIMLAVLRGTKRDVGNAKSQREITRRISKSIAVIIGISFITFAATFVGGLTIPILVPDFGVQMLLFRTFGQLYTVATAINALVLFCFSTEYRELMKKEFRVVRWLSIKIAPANSSIIIVPMAQMVSTQYGFSSA